MMPKSMLEVFGNPYDENPKTVLKPPFGYPGGKSANAKKINSYLPESNTYVEVFGGSGAVLLARRKSKMEVFNDRYAGVVAFYRCMQDHKKLADFCNLVEHSIMSKEDFWFCKENWEKCTTDVERAFRWYYMISYSFGGMARNWGLGKQTTPAGKIRKKISLFWKIHQRFERVQVDNADWQKCMEYYDGPETVFYLDPPYVEADNSACYAHGKIDYDELISTIKHCRGFVAMSGYANPLFDNQTFWDDRIVWDKQILIQSIKHEGQDRGRAEEVLWIKEANNG